MSCNSFNTNELQQLKEALARCCGSTRWVELMAEQCPFNNADHLHQTAETLWLKLSQNDWLEAYSHHPKIGDIEAIKAKFQSTAQWSSNEQASMNQVSDEIIQAFAHYNQEYEDKFGFIFIICATGKSPAQMLSALQVRLNNTKAQELIEAANQQLAIMHLRLDKLLEESGHQDFYPLLLKP